MPFVLIPNAICLVDQNRPKWECICFYTNNSSLWKIKFFDTFNYILVYWLISVFENSTMFQKACDFVSKNKNYFLMLG